MYPLGALKVILCCPEELSPIFSRNFTYYEYLDNIFYAIWFKKLILLLEAVFV